MTYLLHTNNILITCIHKRLQMRIQNVNIDNISTKLAFGITYIGDNVMLETNFSFLVTESLCDIKIKYVGKIL